MIIGPHPKKPKTRSPYRQFLKGGNGNLRQEIPVTIKDEEKIIGFEWKTIDIVDIFQRIPHYNPFINAEEYYIDLDELNTLCHFVVNETIYPEGTYTGNPFIPELWQWGIYFNMFCWKHRKSNNRRYKEVFVYIPRKNGKTVAFGSVPTLYMFYVDKEKRSQNFACAADIEQASLNFSHTIYMIEQNANFLYRLRSGKVNRSTRSFEHAMDGSTFKVLSSIADTKHGLSPNFVYIDEVHAHKSSELIDVMLTGTAAREQSLVLYTTTADYDKPSVCNDLYRRAKAIATGLMVDNSFLPVLYEADSESDWASLKTWKKANPNLGISIKQEYFQRQVEQCKNSPELLNRFLRLHLNIRTSVETIWIPPWIWARGNPNAIANDITNNSDYKVYEDYYLPVNEIKNKLYEFRNWHNIAKTNTFFSSPQTDLYLTEYASYYTWYFSKLEELRNEDCYGAYDNTSVNDIAAFTLYFPNKKTILSWQWVPAKSIHRRSMEDSVPYSMWYLSGIINNTPLECISEIDVIKTLIGDDNEIGILRYFTNVMLVCVDAWGSNFIFESCYNAGIETKKYPQSYAGMNGPCKKLEADITNYNLFHGGHPVLKYQIAKTAVTTNYSEQVRLSKEKSTDKIDSIVSAVMAIGGYMYGDAQMITDIPGLKDGNESNQNNQTII